MRGFVKWLLKRFLFMVGGFHLSRIRSDMADVLTHMKALGFNPRTIIDVGVANGTKDLYEAFPESHFILVEPLREFEAYMQGLKLKYNVDYELVAASSSEGEITFNVHPDLCGSSVLKEVEDSDVNGVERVVPTTTLDKIVNKYNVKGPFLIKVDVQGGELYVLNGVQQIWSEVEVVILEVSLFGFFQNGPQFYDVVQYMKQRGFVAFEIFDGSKRLLDKSLAQVNIAFVREDGVFRKLHSYAHAEQRIIHSEKLRRKMQK